MDRGRGVGITQQALAGQPAVDVLGGLLARGHQGDVLAHDVGDRADEQRVVGAAQDQRVHPGLSQRQQVLLRPRHHLWPGGHAALGQLNEVRARSRQQLDAGNRLQGVGVGPGVHRALGGDEPDPAVARHPRRRAGSGVDHLHHRHSLAQGVATAGIVQHRGRGRVAGDDQHLDPGVHQLVHDGQCQLADLVDRSGPVRGVLGVPDVEHLLPRQLVEDCTRYRQAADAGVEHPDRCVIHAFETRRAHRR